jgi:toxin ParE1/3/4
VARVVISPRADRELEDLWLTISSDDERAANRIVRAIGGKIALLAEYPRLGARRQNIKPTIRMMVEYPYLILYETHPNTTGAD